MESRPRSIRERRKAARAERRRLNPAFTNRLFSFEVANWMSPLVRAIVVPGHQVASGQKKTDRFPGGTLAMQLPFFQERGLDLSAYHLATINASLVSHRFSIHKPRATHRDVKWHDTEPAEDFSFFDCSIREPNSGEWVDALVYYPHPDTKPDHQQPTGVLEILAVRELGGIGYGVELELTFDETQILLTRL